MQQIEIPPECLIVELDSAKTPFSRPFCEDLARSIRHDGLLQYPVVKPDEREIGKYRLIAGRKRAYAAFKILGWPSITCSVVTGLDAEMAESAENAENVFRMELSPMQRVQALKRWRDIYDRRNPLSTVAGGSADGAVRKDVVVNAEVERRAEQAGAGEAEKQKIAAEVAEEAKPFYRALMDTLGVSESVAHRLAKVTAHLTPAQLDLLERHGASQEIALKLADLDEAAVNKAINLMASGLDHKEALRVAGKLPKARPEEAGASDEAKASRDDEVGDGAGEAAQEAAAPKKALTRKEAQEKAQIKAPELTDDEWLDTYCKGALKLIQKKGPFKRDAVLYRRILPLLANFRKNIKKALAEAKHADGNGPFFSSIYRAARASHPGNWYPCGACEASGSVLAKDGDGKESKQQCEKCWGSAYRLKTEN